MEINEPKRPTPTEIREALIYLVAAVTRMAKQDALSLNVREARDRALHLLGPTPFEIDPRDA